MNSSLGRPYVVTATPLLFLAAVPLAYGPLVACGPQVSHAPVCLPTALFLAYGPFVAYGPRTSPGPSYVAWALQISNQFYDQTRTSLRTC